ncbi:MAG: hypothetical protein ACJ8AW_07650 [Rhodopila sp.]
MSLPGHRTGRRSVCRLLPLLMALASGRVQSQPLALERDRIDRPPVRRVFASASGRFVLSLTAVDDWRSPVVEAALQEVHDDGRARRWQRRLPHELGPRSVVVGDDGAVLLVDEWINVLPCHALMVIAADGRILADDSREQVLSRLAVPRATVSAQARMACGEPRNQCLPTGEPRSPSGRAAAS